MLALCTLIYWECRWQEKRALWRSWYPSMVDGPLADCYANRRMFAFGQL